MDDLTATSTWGHLDRVAQMQNIWEGHCIIEPIESDREPGKRQRSAIFEKILRDSREGNTPRKSSAKECLVTPELGHVLWTKDAEAESFEPIDIVDWELSPNAAIMLANWQQEIDRTVMSNIDYGATVPRLTELLLWKLRPMALAYIIGLDQQCECFVMIGGKEVLATAHSLRITLDYTIDRYLDSEISGPADAADLEHLRSIVKWSYFAQFSRTDFRDAQESTCEPRVHIYVPNY